MAETAQPPVHVPAPSPSRPLADRVPGGRALARLLQRLGLAPRAAVILAPYLWLLVFFLLPFLIVLKISLVHSTIAQPPYTPLFPCSDPAVKGVAACYESGNFIGFAPQLEAYERLLADSLYWKAYLNSALTALVSTFFCLLIGYPMAYGIARSSPSVRSLLLMAVIVPFWTSFLIRVYAWTGILSNKGLINNLLIGLGVIDEPLAMMRTQFAIYVGIVYSYLPFMILPLYANLEKMDVSLLEAAQDLGARPLKAFFLITVPLSLPGIIAGSLLVFIPAVGEYIIPELLGGPSQLMIGQVLSDQFFKNRDWPMASAVAVAVLILLVAPLMVFQHYQNKQQGAAAK